MKHETKRSNFKTEAQIIYKQYKTEAQIICKQYRNLLSNLMKESKRSYFTNYFQNNLNDLKSIKKLISLTELSNIARSNVFDNDQSLTEPQEKSNAFSKYFVNVFSDIQSSFRYSKTDFHDSLPPINVNCFFAPH